MNIRNTIKGSTQFGDFRNWLAPNCMILAFPATATVRPGRCS